MVRTPSQAHFSAAKTRSTVALIRARGVAAPDVADIGLPRGLRAGTPGLSRSGQGGRSWRPGRLLPYAAREVVGIEQGFELAGVTVAGRACRFKVLFKCALSQKRPIPVKKSRLSAFSTRKTTRP